MAIEKLDHVNLRTTQLQAMVDWYETVLGLRQGPRPDFPFPGAWMYAGDGAVVHLVGIEGDPGIGSEAALKLEHFALSATDLQEFTSKLDSMGIEYRRNDLAGISVVQVNVWDPDGNHIHVDFATGG